MTDSDDDFPVDLEDVSQKQLLAAIHAEVQAIRIAVTDGAERDAAPMYECKTCHDIVGAKKRAQHLTERHDYPPGLDPEPEFHEV